MLINSQIHKKKCEKCLFYFQSRTLTTVVLEKIIPEEFHCHNPNDNTTQPQHNFNTVVGLGMKMTVHTTPPPTTETQWKPSGASD